MSPLIKLPTEELEKSAAKLFEKAGGIAIDGTAGILGDLFGGLFGDKLKEWRKQNMISGAAKTAKALECRGLDLSKIAEVPGFEVYKIFEGMSLQDDESVQDLWAGLLASRMDPGTGAELDRSTIFLLEGMTGNQARLLNFLSLVVPLVKVHADKNPSIVHVFGKKPDDELHKAHLQALEEWKDKFRREVADLRLRIVGEITETNEIGALKSLQRNGLIIATANIVNIPRLLTTEQRRDGYVATSEEVVIDKNVAQQVERISRRIQDIERGKYGATVPAVKNFENGVTQINYRLTGLGEDFLVDCGGHIEDLSVVANDG